MDTFIFAPEIEQSLVSLCFYNPERIGTVYRELDPSVHITRAHLRQILAAIDLAYRELGSPDFASVIMVLREEGQLEACGGLPGVNSVFEEYRYGFSSLKGEQEIFSYYIERLKKYAIGRETKQPVFTFNRGKGILYANKAKAHEWQPDFAGSLYLAGNSYRVSAKIVTDKTGQNALELLIQPK